MVALADRTRVRGAAADQEESGQQRARGEAEEEWRAVMAMAIRDASVGQQSRRAIRGGGAAGRAAAVRWRLQHAYGDPRRFGVADGMAALRSRRDRTCGAFLSGVVRAVG